MPLALPAYRAYNVRIRPAGENLLAYDASSRRIGLYPGSVASLEWQASPITIKFGRLVTPDGAPIPSATITGEGVWSETDRDGYFQIDVPEDAALTVTLMDGRTYPTALPSGDPQTGIAQIGTIVCCGEDGIRFGALELTVNSKNGGTR